MISVKEALILALSEDFSGKELTAYNTIVSHIDERIKDGFNGHQVKIYVEGAYMNGESFYLINLVKKDWRREIINKKWKRGYSELGWKIEDQKDTNGRICHIFSVDPSFNRDEKLNKLLNV